MKISYILPTCEPKMMFKFLLPSIKYLKSIKDKIEFNIIFQSPYTNDEIKMVLNEFEKYKINVNWRFENYFFVKPYTPLVKMRNDCALMSPDSDIYGLIDDDMSFESSKICYYINKMIDKFESNKNLAVVAFYNEDMPNYRENYYSTNAGLYYRGGKYYGFKGLVPKNLNEFNVNVKTLIHYQNENIISLFGGNQDKFCAMIRLATGQIGECMWNIPVKHLENRKIAGAKDHGWSNAEVLDGSVTQFILKYFNTRFIKTHFLTLFDKELDKIIYPYKYFKNGKIKKKYAIYDNNGISYEGKRKLYMRKISKYINNRNMSDNLPSYVISTLKKELK